MAKVKESKQNLLSNALLSMSDLQPKELESISENYESPDQKDVRVFQIEYPTKHGVITKYVFIGKKGAMKWNHTNVYGGSISLPASIEGPIKQRAW